MSPALQAIVVVAAVGAAAGYLIASAARAYRGEAPSCCRPGAAPGASASGRPACRGCKGCGPGA